MTGTTIRVTGFPRLRLSPMARAFLDELVVARGERQILVLPSCCAAPTVVHIVPAPDFRPAPTQVRVATLASQHEVWADAAELRTCPHEALVIVPSAAHLGRLRLVARADDPDSGR